MFLDLKLRRESGVIVLLVVAACITGLVYLTNDFLTKRKTSTVVRRTSAPSQAKPGGSEKDNYTTAFPPLHKSCFSDPSPGVAEVKVVDLASTSKPLVPLNSDYRQCEPWLFNFTGFSIADIRSLGNFPDYAKLSGVPLPAPLVDFDVDKALPRPYRPFRWAYHQTMCELPHVFVCMPLRAEANQTLS
jgi:hypothetical protein